MTDTEVLTAYRLEMHKIQIKNGFTDEQMISYRQGLMDAIREYEQCKAADVQPAPQWISVEERMPDENQKCLVYRDINADLKITTGIWHSEWKTFDGLRHGTRLEDTIAWMPLPEPPKMDKEN